MLGAARKARTKPKSAPTIIDGWSKGTEKKPMGIKKEVLGLKKC